MKKRAISWVVVAVFLSFLAVLAAPRASADAVLTTVTLSLEQTLALYGTSITAVYYNGSTWESCSFEYFLNSSEQVQSGNNPVETPAYEYDWRMYNTGYATPESYYTALIRNVPRLYYRVSVDDVPNISNGDLMLMLSPSVDISGIGYYRQSVNAAVPASSYQRPDVSDFYVMSSVSYSNTPVQSLAMPWSSGSTYGNWFNTYMNKESTGVQYPVKFFTADVYLNHVENGSDQIFSVGAQSIYVGDILPVSLSGGSYYVVGISCPIVSDGYVLPSPDDPDAPVYGDVLDDISTGVGTSNTLLQQILAKLDLIYQKMSASGGISISGTVEIGGPSITNIGVAIGQSVGSAIQNLFVPSQSDILAWRLNMQSMLESNLAPFYAVEGLRDTAVSRVMAAPMLNYIDVPLIDLTGSGVDFKLTAADFPQYAPIDGGSKIRIPLKVSDSSWSFFYELLAWAIDVYITLAFVNLAINKIHGFFVGDKVVEIDDN